MSAASTVVLCTMAAVAAIALCGCEENKHCRVEGWNTECTTAQSGAARPGVERRPGPRTPASTAEPTIRGSAGTEVEPPGFVAGAGSLGPSPAGATTHPQPSPAPAGSRDVAVTDGRRVKEGSHANTEGLRLRPKQAHAGAAGQHPESHRRRQRLLRQGPDATGRQHHVDGLTPSSQPVGFDRSWR